MSFFTKIGQSLTKSANKVRETNAALARSLIGAVEPMYSQAIKPVITAPAKALTSANNLIDAVSKAGGSIADSAAVATGAIASRTGVLTDKIAASAGNVVDKATGVPTLLVAGIVILAGLVVAPILFRPDATSAAIGSASSAVRSVATRGFL